MGREQPTPLIEGGGLDGQVLGLAEWPRRPRLRLGAEISARPGHYPLAAGRLAGLSQGTILAVFPPAGSADSDRRLGYASIVDIDAVRSVVTPVTLEGEAWRPVDPAVRSPRWRAGSRCALHALSYDFRLRVALDSDEAAGPETGADHGSLEATLTAAVERYEAFLSRVDGTAAADWLVRGLKDGVVLLSASNRRWAAGVEEGAGPGFWVGQRSRPAELTDRLAETLRRIARAHHLLALETTTAVVEDPLEVELGLWVFQGSEDRIGRAVEWGRQGLVLRPGQWVAFEVVNRSRAAVDVTLLFIDSGYGIRPLFPLDGVSNRLGPGERAFPIYRTRLNDATLGKESIVAIAVRAEGPQRSFVDLAQPTLDAYRAERRRGGVRSSPLERLFESVMYGLGGSRGLGATEVADYVVQVLPWETRR